jgi:uroporphyrinogen decarboxylase
VYDIPQQLAIIEPEVMDVLGVDAIELGRGFLTEAKDWRPWTLPDGTACKIPVYVNLERDGENTYALAGDGTRLAVQRKGCLYFEQCFWPMADRPFGADDFADVPWALSKNMWCSVPSPGGHLPFTEEGLKQLAVGARQLRESTDRAILGVFGGNLFEMPQFLYGMDKYLMYMGLYPELCVRLSERLCEIYCDHLQKYLQAAGPYIDVILFGDDLGGQNGTMFSPDMYRAYYKPFHKKMWSYAKELADIKVQLHSCGGIEPLLDDLIDAGLDAVNPVQISCTGMDATGLKQKYGDRLVLWGGGCDTRDVLPNGSPAEVKEHVHQQCAIMNRGGGFVFQQVHNIQANVPIANVIAMFEAVREFSDSEG